MGSSLWISTRIVRGHQLREIEPPHRNVCKGSLQKTRGEVCKVSKEMLRCIAVLLKLFSSNILHIFMVSAAQNIRSNGATSALFKNRIERPETMHFSHSIFVVSELIKQTFGLFLQIEIQTKNQDWIKMAVGGAWTCLVGPASWPGTTSTCDGTDNSTHPPWLNLHNLQ